MAKKKLLDEKGNEVKKPFYKKFWFWVLILIIGVAFSGGDEETAEPKKDPEQEEVIAESSQPKETENESKTEEEPEVTFANVFEEKATKVFGDNLQEVEVNEDGPASDHYISINSKLNGGWNEKTMRDSYYHDVVKVLSSIENEEFNRIIFNANAEMVDKYGNTDEMKVITVNMTKEIVDKMNFENFQGNNLPEIADAMFVHPAFQD